MANLIGLYPDELEQLINENIVLIDVRRENEFHATGIIKNSITLTFFLMPWALMPLASR